MGIFLKKTVLNFLSKNENFRKKRKPIKKKFDGMCPEYEKLDSHWWPYLFNTNNFNKFR